MSGLKLWPAIATASMGIGSVILPIAAIGGAAWGLKKWLSSRQERSQRQIQEAERLRTSIKDLEVETNRRLQRQQQEFEATVLESERHQQQTLERESERLNSALKSGLAQQRNEYMDIMNSQRQEYTQLIADQKHKFNNLIAAERQERERVQQLLQEQMIALEKNIQHDKQQQEKLAQDLLADVESVWTSINQNYQHQRFALGRLEHLKQGLDMARHNIQSGVSQAAIALTQETYLELFDLRNELTRKEQEWLLLYNRAQTNLNTLLAQVQQAKQESQVQIGEDTPPERLNVDYWTHGKLSEYEQELRNLETQLQQGESTLTINQVQAISTQIISLEPQLEEILEQAKQGILASQLRAEIAYQIITELERMGYRLENSEQDTAYEGDDPRAAYVAKMKNIAGDEVVTVITPEQNLGSNSISINTFSKTFVDEKAVMENVKAIVAALKEEGIEQNGQIESRQEPNQRYQDLNDVRRRRPSFS